MKKMIEAEGLTIIGEAKDLEKLRRVITRGSVHFFESVDNAKDEGVCLVAEWTRMGHYAFRLSKAIDNQLKEESK